MGNSTDTARFFNVDSLVAEIDEFDGKAETLDLFVAALAFKTFDRIEKRLALLTECSTRTQSLWSKLVAASTQRYWIQEGNFGIVIFGATAHCGSPRSYRLSETHWVLSAKPSGEWVTLPSEEAFYGLLDSPANRFVFNAWHSACTKNSQHAVGLAEGRQRNTAVDRSLILVCPSGCVVCGRPAEAYAATTLAAASSGAALIQLPLCATHTEVAKSHPSVLKFLETILFLEVQLPEVVRRDAIPDELIPAIHAMVAQQLGGEANSSPELRKNGWFLQIDLASGWQWQFRLESLTRYAYMLMKPGEAKPMFKADAAPHHPELPYPPHHEHSRPDRRNDKVSPSFLYGVPLLDLRHLRDISIQFGALEPDVE